MCALGGRPKEEGGHKRVNISLDKETRRKLEKFKRQGGNVSKFIENEIKPVLERLDPAEQSIHIYRIEAYLSHEIIEAANKGDFKAVKVLGSIAQAIDDYRKLAHIPPLNLPVSSKPSTETLMFKECDYEYLEYCLKKGLITREEIEAISESKSLADNFPGLKPLYDFLSSKIDVLKDIKEKLCKI